MGQEYLGAALAAQRAERKWARWLEVPQEVREHHRAPDVSGIRIGAGEVCFFESGLWGDMFLVVYRQDVGGRWRLAERRCAERRKG